MIYRVFSRDAKLKKALAHANQIEQWLLALHVRGASERIVGTWRGKQAQKWSVEAMAAAA
jgi:hypothetical protein